MSDYYSESDEQSDEIGEELTIEEDRAINIALQKAVSGEAVNNEEISVNSEYVESHNNEDKTKLQNESNEALKAIASADPNDETNAFLLDYFTKRKWDQKQKKPTKEELNADDDLEEIDESLRFEEKYNFRHEEKDFDKIASNPRKVEGESRVKETNRQKKRREMAELNKENSELNEKRLDEIDEKYKQIAEKNGGKLTNEQLHQYAEEYSIVLRDEQGGTFNYSEVKEDGGFEKSLQILNEENNEEEDSNHEIDDDYDLDGDDTIEGKDANKNQNSEHQNPNKNKFNKKKGKFDHKRGHGKFDKNRKKGYRGPSHSRMSTYEAHKH